MTALPVQTHTFRMSHHIILLPHTHRSLPVAELSLRRGRRLGWMDRGEREDKENKTQTDETEQTNTSELIVTHVRREQVGPDTTHQNIYPPPPHLLM